MAEITVVTGDITTLEVDAVVNAANPGLRGGGGVDGAIHRAAGPSLAEECRAVMAHRAPLAPGEVVATPAGDLPARFVLHAVGPVWGADPPHVQDEQLADCYRRGVALAGHLGCRSVAFPNISTGVYGFPKDRAAPVAVAALREALATRPEVAEVVLACFDEENERLTRAALA